MKHLCLLAVLALVACSPAQNAQIAATGTNIQGTVDAVKPVVNAAACQAQAATNIATAGLEQTHNTAEAASSAQASALLGLLCYTTKPVAAS